MNTLTKPLALAPLWLALLSLGSCFALPLPAFAQETRAYAPENLRALSYEDQVRAIGDEYSRQANGRRIPDDQLRFYIDQVQRSNWSFSQVKADISASLSRGPDFDPPVSRDHIRCESTDGRADSCRTPWPGHSRLVRQLSSASCIEGSTWNSQRGQVYVDKGCRADFAAAQVATGPTAGTFRCANAGARYNVCASPWRSRSRLSRTLSKAACTEGRSWGSTLGHVWVAKGCRGEFVAATNPVPGYSVTCASAGGTVPTVCAWDGNKGRPYLVQELSQARCVENSTWGYQTRRGLWVSGGCRARFGAR